MRCSGRESESRGYTRPWPWPCHYIIIIRMIVTLPGPVQDLLHSTLNKLTRLVHKCEMPFSQLTSCMIPYEYEDWASTVTGGRSISTSTWWVGKDTHITYHDAPFSVCVRYCDTGGGLRRCVVAWLRPVSASPSSLSWRACRRPSLWSVASTRTVGLGDNAATGLSMGHACAYVTFSSPTGPSAMSLYHGYVH